MLAMAAKLVRQPLPTMASLPDSFFSGLHWLLQARRKSLGQLGWDNKRHKKTRILCHQAWIFRMIIRQNNRIILGFKWFTRHPSKSFERIKSSPCPRISLSSISVMPFEQFHLVIKCGNGKNYRGFNRKTNGNNQSIPVYHSHVSPATIWGCK